jgi:hypothetical protein
VLRRCVRTGRAGTWSPSAAHARDGAVVEGPVVASQRQGVVGELEGTTGRAPGKEGLVGLTEVWRGGGSVRWRAAGSSPEGGSAATPTSSWSCEGG